MPDTDITQPIEPVTEPITAPEAAPEAAPEPTVDEQALAAFDKGAEEAKPADAEPAAVAKPADPAAPVVPVVPVVPASPAALDVDAEIKSLGLKKAASDRFRELATAVPFKEELIKAGITEPKQIEGLIATAQRAEGYESAFRATGGTPEQISNTLGYVQAINSGDPAKMNQAFEALTKEVQWLGQKLGREVPGLLDPLEAHPDLLNEVEIGDLTRKRALELVQQRATATRATEQAGRFSTQQAQQQETDAAMSAIGQLNATLKANDPQFAAKLPFLQPALNMIRTTLPPSQWVNAIKDAYLALPAIPQPAPQVQQRAPVGNMPLRPTGASGGMVRQPKSDIEAFEMGAASVRP